jgi:hypothetical protein
MSPYVDSREPVYAAPSAHGQHHSRIPSWRSGFGLPSALELAAVLGQLLDRASEIVAIPASGADLVLIRHKYRARFTAWL